MKPKQKSDVIMGVKSGEIEAGAAKLRAAEKARLLFEKVAAGGEQALMPGVSPPPAAPSVVPAAAVSERVQISFQIGPRAAAALRGWAGEAMGGGIINPSALVRLAAGFGMETALSELGLAFDSDLLDAKNKFDLKK